MATPDRERLREAVESLANGIVSHRVTDPLQAAAHAVLEAPEVWVCVEAGEPPGISNLPGGPDHCFFTGKKHLSDCGWVSLVPSQEKETT